MDRKQAWICTGCLAAWIFQTEAEAVEAEAGSRQHRCHVEGATTIIVDATMIPHLTETFGRKGSRIN